MPETDYGDDASPKLGVFSMPQPDINEGRAREYMGEHKQRGADAEAQFQAVMQRRQAAIEEARSKMDGAIERMRSRQNGEGLGGVNLPLLALAAGFLKQAPPGTVSNFGGELSNALTGMGQTIRAQRMSDVELEQGIAGLQQRMAQMRDKGLDDEAGFAKAKALKEDAMVGDLEKALIKSGGAGSKPALVKEYEEWVKDPKNAGKTYGNFLEWKANLGANKNDPAVLRELKAENEARAQRGEPPLSVAQWTNMKSAAGAKGKEIGKSQGEAEQGLPGMQLVVDTMTSDINELLQHPGLDKATGFRSVLKSIPGGDAANFEALLKKVQGQAFLAQFEKLRGAGAITDVEGLKATNALASLDLAQDSKQFRAQLKGALETLKKGQEVLRQKAGRPASAQVPVTIKSKEEFDALKSGTVFIPPGGGQPRVKE